MLVKGTRLGPYEIIAHIGSGGMGDVYRARDTRLDRTVAIKVLATARSDREELRLRFEREARAISNLSHPHICTLFDVGCQDDIDYLVMEYLEGETLAARLDHGALPLDEAMRIAIEIAGALDKAHRQSMVHRDIKPANIMLTKSGAKLLDFGLAKLKAEASPASTLSALPTRAGITAEGTILGTLHYMPPEQLEGKDCDSRADVFAFGAVLYEMLTGKMAFEGATSASVIGAVIHLQPKPVSDLREGVPAALDRVIRKCLAKNADDRWQTCRDLLDELIWIRDAASIEAPVPQTRRKRAVLPWAVAVAAVGAAVLGLLLFKSPSTLSEPEPMRLTVAAGGFPELSPDGRQVAYFGGQQGTGIWVRRIDSLNPEMIQGTEDAAGFGFFWFPDSQSLGVLTQDKLKRFNLTGGPPQVIANLPGGTFGGATANDAGVVLYNAGFSKGPLYRTSMDGGTAPATALDAQREETAHLWPQFLPDGRHFIYLALGRKPENTGIYAGSLDSSDTRLLLKTSVKALFVPPDFLLFVRNSTMMAQSVDPATLELKSEARPVAKPVSAFASWGAAGVTASKTGLIGYGASTYLDPSDKNQLVWLDRSGRQIETLFDPGPYAEINLSPDGKRLAICLQNPTNKSFDIWIADVLRRTKTPFIADETGEYDAEWSPDGRIAFSSDRGGPMGIFEKSTIGAGELKPIFQSGEPSYVQDWSADGRFILYQSIRQMYAFPMTGDRKPILLLDSLSIKDQERFSPDTKWIAYNANDSGTFEVYVVSFPAVGQPIQVSTNGGVQPRWRRDGKEMFYLAPDGKMMSVEVRSSPAAPIDFGAPKVLFQTGLHPPSEWIEQYDVTADGQKFIVITPPSESTGQLMNLIVNWTALLKN